MFEFVSADGTVILYSDHGEGTPVLFLHGWMMSSKVWSFQQPLSGQFRIITIDFRGHGDSNETEFSYGSCLKDIVTLLDHLMIDQIVLAGWSMGAQIAIRFYHEMSSRVAGMILVAGTPCFCMQSDYIFGVPLSEVRSISLRLKREYVSTAGEFFKGMFANGEVSKSELTGIAAQTVGKLPSYRIAVSALQELIDTDLRGILPEISAPVLLVHGLDDKICLPGASEFMSSKIPDADLELFENTGHAPFLSQPEKFNTLMTGFVESL